MVDAVLTLVMALGHLSEMEAEELRPLCDHAVTLLTGRLKPGVKVEDCTSPLALASAWWVLADRAVSGCADEVQGFTVGDVTLRSSGELTSTTRAEALRKQANLVLAPYAGGGSFSFMGVRG